MKSEEEIRARIALLEKMMSYPKQRKGFAMAAIPAQDALQWVLGEQGEQLGSFQDMIEQQEKP